MGQNPPKQVPFSASWHKNIWEPLHARQVSILIFDACFELFREKWLLETSKFGKKNLQCRQQEMGAGFQNIRANIV